MHTRFPFLALCLAVSLPGCAANHLQAIGQAESLLMQDPLSAEGWVALGDAYRKAKREQEAAEAYARALTFDPDNEAARAALSQGDMPLSTLEREALANPSDDELWGDVGDEYVARGNSERALHFYLYALRLDPGDGEWQRKVAENGGIDQIREVLTLDEQSDESLGDMADIFRAAGQEEDACALYARANALDPQDSEWIEGLRPCPQEPLYGGSEYYDHFGGVIDHVDGGSLIGIGGGSDPTLIERGRQALAAGARDQARTYFERALLESPGDREALTGVVVLSGRSATEVLEGLVERLPDNDEVLGDLGDAYISEGRFPEAMEAFRKARAIDPEDGEWLGKLAILEPALSDLEQP